MRKRLFFIVLFVVSITGLAVVQYRYLKLGLNLAGVQFSRKVATAGEDIRDGLLSRNQLTYLLGSVLEGDSTRFNTNLGSMTDASRHFLEDYIRERLVDQEIDTDFRFSLMSRDSTYYLGSAGQIRKEAKIYSYPIELQGYLPTRLGQRLVLRLQFEDLNRYFLTQLNGLTLPSLLFLLGIFIAVIWGLRTYYWQQRTITTTHEFINNLTHELRTPVFSISLAAKIIKEKAGMGEKEEADKDEHTKSTATLADSILQQASRLSTHIDKVLELGSLEKGSSGMPMESFDFLPVLGRVCQQFQVRCEMEGQAFQFDIPDTPVFLMGSAFHLENAVNNLLDNARKYGEGQPIELSASVMDGSINLRVSDQGPGIPPGEQEKIFRKYYRLQDGDRQGVRGYGLGLSYVKTVVSKHQGRITVDSRLGEGTVISLLLPLQKDAG